MTSTTELPPSPAPSAEPRAATSTSAGDSAGATGDSAAHTSAAQQRRAGARRGWHKRAVTLSDQVLSSVSNVLAVVLVARALSPEDFGRFAVGYAVLTLTLGLSRSYFGTRITLVPDPAAARRVAADLVAGILVLAPVIAAAVLAVTLAATGGRAFGIALVVAVATPIVCAQDVLRFGAAAGNRPGAALLSDGVWIAIMALPFVLQVPLSAPAALLLWAGAALGALVVALTAFQERPRLREGLVELRRGESLSTSVTLGTIATSAASLWVLLVVSRSLGPVAAGSLRGAATAMGPVNVLLAFHGLGLTPVLVRRPRSHDLRFCALVAAGTVLAVLAWGSVLLLAPDAAGRAAFGASWDGIRSVLAWTVSEYVWLAVASAAAIGLRVRGQARALLTSRLVTAAVMLLAGTAAALLTQQVWTVAAALVAATLLSAGLTWSRLLVEGRHPHDEHPADQAKPQWTGTPT